jgi:predicted DNA binding CopG/RHH family protein
MIPNGIYVDDADALDAEALVACGFVAGAIPMTPPTGWFENPKLDKPTPLTVDDDGRVYGHIAAWNVDHIGMANGTRPPRSKSNYAYFHTGVVRTEDGSDVPVGQLTLAGGHASIEASAYEAAKHYDDTASAVADVHAGEDQHGIWVAGALRPGAEPEQIRSLRASAPSGDWRPIRGSLELVAVCQVNVPGFPIARARVASGQVMALVAAGAATLAKLKHDPVADLTSRIKKLEQFGASKDLASKAAELAARVHASAEFADISEAQRKKLAEKGQALPDGSYPIRNVTDLKNAVQSYGRAAAKDKAKVRKHISKRANELKRPDLIPDNWKSTSVESITASAEDLKARVAAAQEALGKAFAAEPVDDGRTKYTFKTQPRDSKGKFRQVLAVLRDNLGKAGLTEEAKQAERVQELRDAGQYDASDKAAAELLDTVQRISTGALSNNLESVKLAAMQLGTAVSNAPLPFGVDTKRMRFSDLPAPLQKLTADMMDRVEKRIGKKESDQATKDLRSYISGSDLYSQSEVSAQLSKMLRLLT